MFDMKRIPPLAEGSKVAFAAPSRKIDADTLATAIEWCEKQGFEPVFDESLNAAENQYAGSDSLRAEALQRCLDSKDIAAIIAMRGGYGALRIVDSLNFDRFAEHPKWFVGYSDATVLHGKLQSLGFESLHATMPINFSTNTQAALSSLTAALKGDKINYSIDYNSLNRTGKTEAEIVGGNLSVLYSMIGSNSFPNTDGKILFIEDLDEYLYHIDRMVLAMKRAHVFDNLAGMVVGAMTQMHDNTVPFGKTAEEIVCGHVAEYGFPVCFGFPAGHINDNRAFVLGRKTCLKVTRQKTTFEQEGS